MIAGTAEDSQSNTNNHVLFFDFIRNMALLSVVLYHSVSAYSTMALWWPVRDGTLTLADVVRQVFDVFMMPMFFFIAGYFVLPSLKKRDFSSFLKVKFRRLGIPWLLAILTVVSLVGYKEQSTLPAGQAVRSFWHYWIYHYLGSFGKIQFGMLPPGQTNQVHYWYISLLLSFFIVLGLVYQVVEKVRRIYVGAISPIPPSNMSITRTLILFGLLTSTIYFAAMLFIPDQSWLTIGLLLQFQPTRIGLYALYFGLGIYAYSRQWFTQESFRGSPKVWALGSIVLIVGYLVVGQGIFSHPYDSQVLSPALLLKFTFARSFLCLVLLVLFISFAQRYMNRSFKVNERLARHSLNIYLVHLFLVIMFQGILTKWGNGPLLVKIGVVWFLTILFSYGLSYLINRFPRGFAAGLVLVFVIITLT